jgi:flagellar assembly protein FliH
VMVQVRPARLDRPLRRTALDPAYTDPHLEEMVRVATEQAREEARAQGYAVGWAQGRQAAGRRAEAELAAATRQARTEREDAARRVSDLLTALGQATRAAEAALAPEWGEVADTLAEGALQLAAAALGRELRSIDDTVARSVRSALNRLSDPGDAVVHLNPADAEHLVDAPIEGVRVVADPQVTAGSLIAETPGQRLRHDLPRALAAAEEVLRS